MRRGWKMRRGYSFLCVLLIGCSLASGRIVAKEQKGQAKEIKKPSLVAQGTLKLDKEKKKAIVTTKKGDVTFTGDLSLLVPLDGKTVMVTYEEVKGKKVVKEAEESGKAIDENKVGDKTAGGEKDDSDAADALGKVL